LIVVVHSLFPVVFIYLQRILKIIKSIMRKGVTIHGDKEGPGKEGEKNIKKEITRYDRMDNDSIP